MTIDVQPDTFDPHDPTDNAQAAWDAREPEIAALREQVQTLREVLHSIVGCQIDRAGMTTDDLFDYCVTVARDVLDTPTTPEANP